MKREGLLVLMGLSFSKETWVLVDTTLVGRPGPGGAEHREVQPLEAMGAATI